jgi:3-methyladenine DNA glycosylase AlkD
LRSPWHEERLLALFVLVHQYGRAEERRRIAIFDFYVRHMPWINNWDLVDCSAGHIVGTHLRHRSRRYLRQLARSKVLWRRRIAIMATFDCIRQGEFDETLRLASVLLRDPHDLIHKAVGWMLREVGNRDRAVEERFLRRHARQMPRTMLRYAIEHFPQKLRQSYLGRSSA